LINATQNALLENGTYISEEQIKSFINDVFKSGGNRDDLYRVVLKKALKENSETL